MTHHPFAADGDSEDTARQKWREALTDMDSAMLVLYDDISVRVHEFKESIVQNGPADMDPVLFVIPTVFDRTAVLVQMIVGTPDEMDPHEEQHAIGGAIAVSLDSIRATTGQPLVVGFVTEIWHSPTAHDAREWPSERPDRTEAVLARCYWLAGSEVHDSALFMPYHYGDGGVVWDDPVIEYPDGQNNTGLGHAIDPVLRRAFTRESN